MWEMIESDNLCSARCGTSCSASLTGAGVQLGSVQWPINRRHTVEVTWPEPLRRRSSRLEAADGARR